MTALALKPRGRWEERTLWISSWLISASTPCQPLNSYGDPSFFSLDIFSSLFCMCGLCCPSFLKYLVHPFSVSLFVSLSSYLFITLHDMLFHSLQCTAVFFYLYLLSFCLLSVCLLLAFTFPCSLTFSIQILCAASAP